MRFKGKHIDPYESFYWDTTPEFFRGQLGGGISRTVKTSDSLAIMEEVKIAAMRDGNYQQRLEVNENGTSNTITSVQKDNLVCEPLFIPEATAKGYAEATEGDSVNLEQPNSKTRRGRVGKQIANTLTTSCNQGVVTDATICLNSKVDGKQPSVADRIYDTNGIAVALTSGWKQNIAEVQVQQIDNLVVEPLNPYKDGTCRTIKAQYQQSSRANFTRQDGLGATGVVQNRYRIRKLTPRECFRLMDVDENVIDTIQAAGISNSQQYKLAGNSIVVACLEKIFEQMLFPQYTNSRTLFG